MIPHELLAVTSLDGRYAEEIKDLRSFVSEAALTTYRLEVEAHWLLHLADPSLGVVKLGSRERAFLEDISSGKIPASAVQEIKLLEKTTNHDVKAVEYWLRGQLASLGASAQVQSHIHFACTSEDINNVAYALMLQDLRSSVILPRLKEIKSHLTNLAKLGSKLPMLSRTHGQSASPTTIGKEMAVFSYRLSRQERSLKNQAILAKFNGAVGNFNAHAAAYPAVDWTEVSRAFIEVRLNLTWNPLTTQIENHDGFVEYMQTLHLINSIMIDFTRDMWGYISLGYFSQKKVGDEVGSSTMPHKINPIYFENAEGNLGVSNALLAHFSQKLPISRWQRDLSDSTVLRVTGTAVGHAILAYINIVKGLSRVSINEEKLAQDLSSAWELLGEPVQTVMRRFGVVDAYERLKYSTRGSITVTRDMIHQAIDGCAEIPADEKLRMKQWTPLNYLGYAERLSMESFDK